MAAIRVAQIMGKWVGGGVESVVMNYYRNINHQNIQFDFICDSDSTNIPYEEIESLGGKVILVPPYQSIFKYHKALKIALKDYSIVHSHINVLSVFSLFAAKCSNVKVRIAHSHSTTNKKEWKKNILKQILKHFSKFFATDYMCCSMEAGRFLFGNKTYNSGKVYLMNNAIDVDLFEYNKNMRKKMRDALNIGNDTLVIGHVGRFVEQKNQMFLLDVFKGIYDKNSNSVLILVGQGPLEEDLREKVSSLHLDNNVFFLGQRSDVSSLYQAMDIFLLPSLYEGLGMVLIEAQVAGLLSFASDFVPQSAKISTHMYFYSLCKSSELWALEILRLSKNYKRESCKKEAILNHFDIKNEAKLLEEKYIELYKR